MLERGTGLTFSAGIFDEPERHVEGAEAQDSGYESADESAQHILFEELQVLDSIQRVTKCDDSSERTK